MRSRLGVRSSDGRSSRQIAVAQVIGEDDDEVGGVGGGAATADIRRYQEVQTVKHEQRFLKMSNDESQMSNE